MRGQVAIAGAVLAAVVAMFLHCSPKAKTSAGYKIKNVAVVEAEIDAESDASASLNKAEVRQITAVLRKEAVKNLPQGKYNIMTTETVMSQGSAVLEECADENCVIKVGAAIGADYIVRGTVSKFEKMLTVSVDMYETNDGNLVASSELVRSENIIELLDKAAGASGEMYRKFENPKGAAAKQTAVYQTTDPAPTPTPTPTKQKANVDDSGTFIDSRDNKRYKTVVILWTRWMAENLNYKKGKSWCYENKNSNCDKYGRLYDWNTAKTVCPEGWRLPSNMEWQILEMGERGTQAVAGTMLKARSGWKDNGIGTDDYGFSALPGGYRDPSGKFDDVGDYGFWWTDTENGARNAYLNNMGYDYNYVGRYDNDKRFGNSVRCVASN